MTTEFILQALRIFCWEMSCKVLFRLTKKTQDQIKHPLKSDNSSLAENRYCEWICDTVQYGRKKYFLISNAYSSFSMLISTKGVTNSEKFQNYVLERMESYFAQKGFQNCYNDCIKPNSENICYAKTNSRVLTGLMNEQKLFLEYDYYDKGDFPEDFSKSDDLNEVVSCALDAMFKKYTPEQVFTSDAMKNAVLPEGIPAKYREWN